jgi:hypothetical protein
MKLLKLALMMFAIVCCVGTNSPRSNAQTTVSARRYQEMAQNERSEFVASESQRIAGELSGRHYEFTPAFIEDVQQALERYFRRVGKYDDTSLEKRDLRLVFLRGEAQAPIIIAAFKARNISPLIGLYIPWIESEYENIQQPHSMGAVGIFQFLPQTGERYGLSAEDLLDVGKSADAAARYITDSLDKFKDDPMKEALALMAYNRGEQQTSRDLKIVLNDKNKRCSICALTADRSKRDEALRSEKIYYVPSFFAAAIIGENPAAFGWQSQPLSSH